MKNAIEKSILGDTKAFKSLITADKDFGDPVFRQHRVHAGVVLLRLAGLPSTTKARIVGDVLQSYGAELLDAFSVISPANVHIRKRKP